MSEFLALFETASGLAELQQRLVAARRKGTLILQNGDLGYASAPSNIALLKYWGKAPGRAQIPVNSSLSYTLGGFRSFTKVAVRGRFFPESSPLQKSPFENRIALNNSPFSVVDQKMDRFVRAILSDFAPEISLDIVSRNNFPTACGIASSASGYAALVGAIADLLQLHQHFNADECAFWLTQWARLGSGSATRSAVPSAASQYVAWHADPRATRISDASATHTVAAAVHPTLTQLDHMVVVLEVAQKAVSSSDGHRQADTSVFQGIRVAGMPRKMQKMHDALALGDFATIASLSEEDAFAMHAVMQTAQSPACYLTQDTARVIETFVHWRDLHGIPAFWTLDAGPNVHLLFLPSAEKEVLAFVQNLHVSVPEIKQWLKNNSNAGLLLGKQNYLKSVQQTDLLTSWAVKKNLDTSVAPHKGQP